MNNQEVTIILADDDVGHRSLMRLNLNRCNIANNIMEFEDGQELLGFFTKSCKEKSLTDKAFMIFLDIRMPKMNGIEVLQILKADKYLRRIPIIMVTTTDDPSEIARCHELGCSYYVTKPVDYEKFIGAVRNLGLFLSIVQVPRLD
ncbi:response regulator [Cerasicoccus arenae]|uniref:Response regulator n=1 Tax=Cerasicoccus arenae TaxID=424488 RepID=A0A8J3DCI3_9BACT|nr:response regulator [Cerasicoccus arenae]MBK1859567.1 response regulator [Cerasicoccus arenae]GHC03064.1 response regulator [Cerasicoccus arenae]